MMRVEREEGKQKKDKVRQSKSNVGEAREVVLPPFDLGEKMVECQCSIGRATKQHRSDDKVAARLQQGVQVKISRWTGGPEEVETAKTVRVEWKLRKMQVEDHFNKEAKERWRFAADAARITDERASNKDRKHKSGRVCCNRKQSGSSYWWRRGGQVNPRK